MRAGDDDGKAIAVLFLMYCMHVRAADAKSIPQVTVPPTLILRPGAPSRLEVAFRPLLAGEAAAVVSIAAPQLGPLRYGLRLLAAAAAPLRPLSFAAVLGSSQSQVPLPSCHAHLRIGGLFVSTAFFWTCFALGCCACVGCMLLYRPMHAPCSAL